MSGRRLGFDVYRKDGNPADGDKPSAKSLEVLHVPWGKCWLLAADSALDGLPSSSAPGAFNERRKSRHCRVQTTNRLLNRNDRSLWRCRCRTGAANSLRRDGYHCSMCAGVDGVHGLTLVATLDFVMRFPRGFKPLPKRSERFFVTCMFLLKVSRARGYVFYFVGFAD